MAEALKRKFEEAAEVDAMVAKQKQARGREIGTVQMYDKGKGFGFIIDSDKENIFVHHSQIVAAGFRRLMENQKVSFLRGENRGKPWAEDVRNPDGTPIALDKEEEGSSLAKKRRQQLKEQWRNFFEIPQYALKGHGESLPTTANTQDAYVIGETVPQLGKVFVVCHGSCAVAKTGNECSRFVKEKMAKYIARAYEEKPDASAALHSAYEAIESEFMERAKMKSLTDCAEVICALFVHALNAAGQPCVQLWVASAGGCTAIACGSDGTAMRLVEPQTTDKARAALEEAGYKVSESGKAEVAFAEVGEHKPSSNYILPAARVIGGRPFKTSSKAPVHARPEVRKVREWRCVAGEELFLVLASSEIMSVLSDQDVINASMDSWGGATELDGWEAAAKAVVRTAQAQGPDSDTLACLAVQCWWQEKPLQRLLARRADRKRSGLPAVPQKKAADDGLDMFS